MLGTVLKIVGGAALAFAVYVIIMNPSLIGM